MTTTVRIKNRLASGTGNRFIYRPDPGTIDAAGGPTSGAADLDPPAGCALHRFGGHRGRRIAAPNKKTALTSGTGDGSTRFRDEGVIYGPGRITMRTTYLHRVSSQTILLVSYMINRDYSECASGGTPDNGTNQFR
jgi:hypothetical protein